jgi:biopolymer transport protein ExbD
MEAAMKFGKNNGKADRLDMDMTPMIDVCFQLIIFFMLSLRLYSPEGDFSVKMPLAAPEQGLPDETQSLPVQIRLRADASGNLAALQMGQRTLRSFEELRQQIRDICGLDRGPAATPIDTEVEIDSDYNLKFEYVMEALSAISGYMADDKQTIVRLIEKIRFTPPRKKVE